MLIRFLKPDSFELHFELGSMLSDALIYSGAIKKMGFDARKPVCEQTQAQTSLCIRTVRSAPLLFDDWKVLYVNLLQVKFKISSLSL